MEDGESVTDKTDEGTKCSRSTAETTDKVGEPGHGRRLKVTRPPRSLVVRLRPLEPENTLPSPG